MTTPRLSQRELEKIRRVLIQKKAELSQLTQRLAEESALGNPRDQGEISSLPTHLADLGSETFEQDTTLGLAERSAAELQETQQALDRMDEGTYGICINCRGPILLERLRARPSASRCTSCQAAQEAA